MLSASSATTMVSPGMAARREIIAGVTTGEVTSNPGMLAAASTSASPRVAQQMPIAPAPI